MMMILCTTVVTYGSLGTYSRLVWLVGTKQVQYTTATTIQVVQYRSMYTVQYYRRTVVLRLGAEPVSRKWIANNSKTT